MSTILAGRFEQQDQANAALAALRDAGFDSQLTSSFFLNPRGQHALTPIGGDADDSRAAHQAPKGSGMGAAAGGVLGAALGVAAIPVAGPAAAAAGAVVAAGVGAYTGSLIGTLNKLGEPVPSGQEDAGAKAAEEHAPPRHAGMMVAVVAPTLEAQDAAFEALQISGAMEIEQSEGEIAGGNWVDFDPNRPLHLIESGPSMGADG
ncbi:MAG TPA: hypothetical protein VGN52_21240 [Burkholderiales bacterium]|jgi:hypothetical protein